MSYLGFRVSFILALLGSLAFAIPYPLSDVHANRGTMLQTARSTNTCADPSLAKPIFQAFELAGILHNLDFRPAFEGSNTLNMALTFTNLHPAFNAWPTQQEFTVPLWQIGTPDGKQIFYAIGADADTPPTISGFTAAQEVVAWVYNSQVCGSVPLMSVAIGGTLTDHYFTTDSFEHDLFTAGGWADSGVVAFVLPLNNP